MHRYNAPSSTCIITEEAAARKAQVAEIDEERLTTESDDEVNSETPIMDRCTGGRFRSDNICEELLPPIVRNVVRTPSR